MAFETYEFSGKAAWLSKSYRVFKNKPEEKVWSFAFYGDAATRKALKATGIKNHAQEDTGEKSGIEGMYFTLRSKEEFPIVDTDGNDITVPIGNGSEVTVDLVVETFESKQHGPQARSSVARVVVTKLIPYVKDESEGKASEELPA